MRSLAAIGVDVTRRTCPNTQCVLSLSRAGLYDLANGERRRSSPCRVPASRPCASFLPACIRTTAAVSCLTDRRLADRGSVLASSTAAGTTLDVRGKVRNRTKDLHERCHTPAACLNSRTACPCCAVCSSSRISAAHSNTADSPPTLHCSHAVILHSTAPSPTSPHFLSLLSLPSLRCLTATCRPSWWTMAPVCARPASLVTMRRVPSSPPSSVAPGTRSAGGQQHVAVTTCLPTSPAPRTSCR